MNQEDNRTEHSDGQFEKTGQEWICGFWQRIIANWIDMAFLGLIGFGSGYFLEAYFVKIGVWGRLIGFCVAIIYFGVMNSTIFNGQTLGKKALKLRVVNIDNNPISLIRSLGRYCILGIPYFLNGASFSNENISPFWGHVLSLIIWAVICGGFFSIIYLYVFNRITRQSLHDLVFGTYVVNVGIKEKNIANVWKPHLIVVGVFFIAVLIVPLVKSNFSQQEPLVGLKNSQETLMKNPLVNHVSVLVGKTTSSSIKKGDTVTTFVKAQIFLKENQVLNKALARELAGTLANSYPQTMEKDIALIELIYAYDIGIFKKWFSYKYTFKP
ncbi:RDD family protein [Crenothrix polyspora]|uniref:RDD domain-containing protein n=1 Tax=Crenothrix polyspora TaxID=360316 RepID=A0A1R4H9H4_9GAMM|nr:RDD family protein [Crenothrix polyspora]SJM92914.1 conserved membrane hypothetical protein [Crenothrix polyspora]